MISISQEENDRRSASRSPKADLPKGTYLSHTSSHSDAVKGEALVQGSVQSQCHSGQTRKAEPSPDDLPEMTPEQLAEINQRWEQFYHQKKAFLHRYAWGDEDLVSIGLLAVRKTLGENPQCPQSWLVQSAKCEINTARASTGRVYLSLDRGQHHETDWVNDELQYEAMTALQRNPEIVFLDRVKYKKMWAALSEMERKFVKILREEYISETRHRWWRGKYSHTLGERPKPKKRFRTEVSHSITDYYVSYANVRYHFYMNFGTEEEIEREKAWYASFDPKGRLHANRDGRYKRS